MECLSPVGKPCLNKIEGGEGASVIEKKLLISVKAHSRYATGLIFAQNYREYFFKPVGQYFSTNFLIRIMQRDRSPVF